MALRRGQPKIPKSLFDYPGVESDYQDFGRYWFPEWEIEHLVNHFLSMPNNRLLSRRRLNCRSWTAFALILNQLKRLENAESTMDIPEGGIIDALPRLFWPQASWQIGYLNSDRLYRSWFLYLTPEASDYFRRQYGISVERLAFIGFSLFASAAENHLISLADSGRMLGIDRESLLATLKRIGRTHLELRAHAAATRAAPGVSAFKRSPIREYPCVQVQPGSIVAPLPELIMARVTEGLYFDLVGDGGMRARYARRFEEYVTNVLRFYAGTTFNVVEGATITDKAPPDILVENVDQALSLIVECKARRLPHQVLSSANSQQEVSGAYDDLVKAVVQVWRFADRLSKGEFFRWKSSSANLPIGLVLTLDPWTQMGNNAISFILQSASAKADEERIPPQSRVPTTFVSCHDLEVSLQSRGLAAACSALKRLCNHDRLGYFLSTVVEEEEATGEVPVFPYSERLGELVPWMSDSVDVSASTFGGLP